MSKLYVGNISYDVTDADFEDLFGAKGDEASVKIVHDRDTGRSKGFGFVEMASEDGLDDIISDLNGYEFKGRPLKVDKATDKPRRSGGPGGGGGGRDGGGGGGRGRRW